MRKLILSLFIFSCSGYAENWSIDSDKEGWSEKEFARTYYHFSEMQRQWAWHLMGGRRIEPTEKILDVGCGDGKITAELSHFVPEGKILGVDLSSPMIEIAQKKFAPVAFPNLSFKKTDGATQLGDLGIEAYDRIVSFCCFHVVSDPIALLEQMRSALKMGGELDLVIPNIAIENPGMIQAANITFEAFSLTPPWKVQKEKPALALRETKVIQEVLEDLGFEVIKNKNICEAHPYIDEEEFISWCIGTVCANWAVPKEIAQDYFKRFTEEMSHIYPEFKQEDGSIHFPSSYIEVAAKKKER